MLTGPVKRNQRERLRREAEPGSNLFYFYTFKIFFLFPLVRIESESYPSLRIAYHLTYHYYPYYTGKTCFVESVRKLTNNNTGLYNTRKTYMDFVQEFPLAKR